MKIPVVTLYYSWLECKSEKIEAYIVYLEGWMLLLIAFAMLPTDKSQKKNNLVCVTAACNGHMANIEAAVKKFIYEFKRPLGLEVTATIYVDTHIARRIRYRIYDKKGSKMSHSEYFDALTDNKSDAGDYEVIYNRMKNTFEE